jgi:hypothetical protein
MAKNQNFVAEPSEYPKRIKPDFKKPEGEKEVIKAYKEQLGKTKIHKFKTIAKG